jgi:hypothetical protein
LSVVTRVGRTAIPPIARSKKASAVAALRRALK